MSERTVYDALCTVGKKVNTEARRSKRDLQSVAYKFQDDEDNPHLEVLVNRARDNWRQKRIELSRHVAHCTDGCVRATGPRQVPMSKTWDRAPSHAKPERPRLSEIAAMLRAGARLADLAPQWGRRVDGLASALNLAGWHAGTGEPLTEQAPKPRGPVQPSPTWMDSALCAQTDAEQFFPEAGGSVHGAKRICMRCPVRTQCLEWAIANGWDDGVWGGLSKSERRKLLGSTKACADCGAEIPRAKCAPKRCDTCGPAHRATSQAETKRQARLKVAS